MTIHGFTPKTYRSLFTKSKIEVPNLWKRIGVNALVIFRRIWHSCPFTSNKKLASWAIVELGKQTDAKSFKKIDTICMEVLNKLKDATLTNLYKNVKCHHTALEKASSANASSKAISISGPTPTPPPPPNPEFEKFQERVQEFAEMVPFPTENNLSINFADTEKLQAEVCSHAKATGPLFHGKTNHLLTSFLEYKLKWGTDKEKALYATMDEGQLIDRLLAKRPLMFMGPNDAAQLRDTKYGSGGFENIGTDSEVEPLTITEYISYDEMQVAALIGIIGPTHFINNGSRKNEAEIGDPGTFEEKGIYAGLVGARFEVPGSMEWQHMIIDDIQNQPENGYGKAADANTPERQHVLLWESYYDCEFPTFEEAKADTTGKYVPLGKNGDYFLNAEVYKKRMRAVIEPYLVYANSAAEQENKKAYVHAVGLGLGVWKVTDAQTRLQLEVYAELLKEKDFAHIADIDFSYFTEHKDLFEDSDSVNIHFTKREPAAKLEGDDAGKLLVACYAWDGNAFIGNEYWSGALSASGDPAAACCSNIAELQNPMINPNIQENVFIFGQLLKA